MNNLFVATLVASIVGSAFITEALAQSDREVSPWLQEVASMNFPREFACGKVHGLPFKVENADFDGQFLHLVQGKNWIDCDRCLIIVFKDKKIAGKDYFVLPGRDDSSKAINTINKIWLNADGTRTTRALNTGFALRLHFGEEKNGRIPAYLIVRVDDARKSPPEKDEVAGYCEVKILSTP